MEESELAANEQKPLDLHLMETELRTAHLSAEQSSRFMMLQTAVIFAASLIVALVFFALAGEVRELKNEVKHLNLRIDSLKEPK